MVMTKSGSVPGGPTGIPNPDPITTDQGGPEGIGGRANTVNPPRTRPAEPGGNTAGTGQNADLFDPWGGRSHPGAAATNSANPSGGAGSNVNQPYPDRRLAGTQAASETASGRIMRGGRGRPGK